MKLRWGVIWGPEHACANFSPIGPAMVMEICPPKEENCERHWLIFHQSTFSIILKYIFNEQMTTEIVDIKLIILQVCYAAAQPELGRRWCGESWVTSSQKCPIHFWRTLLRPWRVPLEPGMGRLSVRNQRIELHQEQMWRAKLGDKKTINTTTLCSHK